MSGKTIYLDDQIFSYLLSVSLREDPVLEKLRIETASHPKVNMQISPEQGQFMSMLIKLCGAVRCIEIGVFTGYSSLATALALPPEGSILACDINEDYTNTARRYWEMAGVSEKIDLRIGPALETLDELLKNNEQESYDFAFLDADKGSYPQYYEKLLALMRPGGLIAVDNVLWDGRVADPSNMEEDTKAIRLFNSIVRDDERVDISLVPTGDGLSLIRKR